MNLKELIDPIAALAIDAGQAILEVYATDFDVQSKLDKSPLTQADLAAHHCIIAGLAEITPDMPIISEESGLPSFSERSQWQRYWLVDPLDGTKEFVNRNGEFTVNIALIDSNRPVFGVVHVPVQDKTYIGCEGYGTELRSRDAAARQWPLRLNRWLLLPLAVSLAAWLSSLPLLVATFQQFSPWGWLNTLLVYPLVVVVMFLGFAALLVGLVSGLLAGVLTALLEPAAGLLIAWVSWLGMIPGVLVHTTSPPSAWVWLFYAGLAAWAAVHHRLVGLRLGLAVTVAWLVATAVWVWPTPPGGRLTMTVLSVGRGTSIIIELPEGGVVLYDAGSSGSYDPGPGTILPFLAYRGIGQIEAAIISHPNLDHFGGLPSVADGIDVGSVMLSSHFEPLSRRTQEGAGRPTKPSWKLLKEIERRGLETLTIDSSTGPFEIGGASFEILWPPPTPPFELTANDSSLGIRVTHRGRRILLTGDIEDGAQGYLLSSGVDLSADVLLLPHHGSVRRSSRAFVEAVAPELVIRSASQRSADSSTGLREVIGDRRALNTADVGAIEVILDGDGVHWSAFHADPGETSAGQPASPR